MKTVLLLIGLLIVVTIVFLFSFFYRIGKPVNSALSDSYYHHAWKNKIIHSPMGNWFELGYRELEADPATFQVLSREFAKDASHVFWQGKVQAVDLNSFTVDEQGIPKDQFKVYYAPDYLDSLYVIAGADPASYKAYKPVEKTFYYRWGQDNHSFFLEGKKINVDRNTFRPLNETLALDTNSIYIIKRDPESLSANPATEVIRKAANTGAIPTVISDHYLQLGNTILLSNWKNDFAQVSFEDIKDIRLLDERNLVVNTILISDGKRMEEIDIASLEILNRDFLKDKNSVYFDTHKIEGADAESFTPIYEAYSKDKHQVYYKDKVLTGANPTDFSFDYPTNVATDGRLYFKDGIPIKKPK